MSPLQTLAPDQRAILELLLRQGRSYGELSELLGLPEPGVRSRAHAALEALVPDRPAPVGEDGAVADWLLGQQEDGESERTRASVAGIPAWRTWAAEVADRLAEVDGAAVPTVPEAREAEPPSRRETPAAGAAPAARPRRPRPVRDAGEPAAARPRPVRAAEPAPLPDDAGSSNSAFATGAAGSLRSSRLGGAVLIGVLIVLVGGVLFVLFGRGDDDEPTASSASATPTATATATPQVVNEVVLQGVGSKAQGLMRVFKRDTDGKLVFALAADKMPANRAKEVYAVWFTKKRTAPRLLGFAQTQVTKEGTFQTGGPQEGQEADFARWLAQYDHVVVARAGTGDASTKRPGAVALRGTLPGGQ